MKRHLITTYIFGVGLYLIGVPAMCFVLGRNVHHSFSVLAPVLSGIALICLAWKGAR